MTLLARLMCVVVLALWALPATGWALTDPLNAQVRFSLPDSVETVGEAFVYFLASSQYQITMLPPASLRAREGFRASLPFPLPVQHVLTVKQALLAVTPEAWGLVIDRENQLISLMPYDSKKEEE